MSKKSWALALALASITAVGCAQEKAAVTDDFSELATMDEKSDTFSTRWKLLGSLSYGQTSSTVTYVNPPRYRAFKFAGAPGDEVDVWVRSTNGGDAVAWVLNDRFGILGYNDDATRTNLDSHVNVTLTANANPAIVTYYVVFRDYDLSRAKFRVELKKLNTGCDYAGQHYSEGASFPSTDGCNTCNCGANGSVGCTKRACISQCNYGGNTYQIGDSFPSTDGCNTCSCGPNGSVACTKRACLPNWNKKYVGTPTTCQLIRFLCEPGTNYFSDAQGCGCEQPSDCPQVIDCEPPTDCSAERARCPLSTAGL